MRRHMTIEFMGNRVTGVEGKEFETQPDEHGDYLQVHLMSLGECHGGTAYISRCTKRPPTILDRFLGIAEQTVTKRVERFDVPAGITTHINVPGLLEAQPLIGF